jgi:hypothetical protein
LIVTGAWQFAQPIIGALATSVMVATQEFSSLRFEVRLEERHPEPRYVFD